MPSFIQGSKYLSWTIMIWKVFVKFVGAMATVRSQPAERSVEELRWQECIKDKSRKEMANSK